MKLEMFHETVLKYFMKYFSLIIIISLMFEIIHFVSNLSQWHNGRSSRDIMSMHVLSACKENCVAGAVARLSQRYTEELIEL